MTVQHDPVSDPRYGAVPSDTPIATTAGMPVLVPEPKRHIYRAASAAPVEYPALALRFTPNAQNVTVSITIGAGPVAVAAVGNAIQVTALQAGTTTYANLLAAWNAAAGVLDLATLTGDAGTFPATYTGMSSTALSTTRIAEGVGLTGLCTDGVWRPVRLLTDGSLEVSVSIGDAIKAYQYVSVEGGTPVQADGVTANIPEAKTYTYDAGPPALTMTFTPYINGLSVGLSDTGAESVTIASGFITITVNGTTTNDVSLTATWAASDAAAVCGFAMDAGTVPGAATYGPQDLWTERTVAAGADVGLDTADGSYIPAIVDSDGKKIVRPHIVPIGAATAATSASPVVGTTGRLPADVTLTIDAGMDITVHPLCGGVTVAVTTAAAAAVAATGNAVTLTALNTGATTVADMQALIAADASVAALLTITGTALDTFDAALAIAATDLWTEGVIAASAQFALDEDGNWSPAAQGSNSVVMVPIGSATPAAADEQVGVTGRLPQDLSFTISAGNDITIHPKQGGVSVIVATAAAAAVSATGKVVTLTSKNDDSTDVTAMLALIAASASVNALLSISGTGADLFDHTLVLAETPLWTTGTIPANALIALDSSGYWLPVETDTSGGIKMSMTSLIAGEDITAGRLKVMPKCATGSGGILAASGTGHNEACVVHRIMIAETGGANPITVLLRDNGAGGTIKTPTFTVAASGSVTHELNTAFGTDVYITCGGAGTPSVCVNVHSG